jgi:hypothetical protein
MALFAWSYAIGTRTEVAASDWPASFWSIKREPARRMRLWSFG